MALSRDTPISRSVVLIAFLRVPEASRPTTPTAAPAPSMAVPTIWPRDGRNANSRFNVTDSFLLLPAGFLKRRFSLDLQPISVDVQTGAERRTSRACAQSLPRLLNSSIAIIFLLSSSSWIATQSRPASQRSFMHERSEKVRGRWKHACTRFSDQFHFSKGSTHDSTYGSPTDSRPSKNGV